MKIKPQFMYFLLVTVLATLLVGITACSADEDIHEITDRFFDIQMTSVLTNPEEYLGRTIRYQGEFWSSFWEPIDCYVYFVVRISDDCCAGNPVLGMSVYLNDIPPAFEEGTWVEVTGVFEEAFIAGVGETVRLNAISIVERERQIP